MKRRRKVKWGRVIVLVLFTMIVVGGIFMYFNKKDTTNKRLDNNTKDNLDKDKDKDTKETNSSLEKAPLNNLEFSNLSDGEYLTSKGYTLVIKDGLAYVDNHLIVNKTYNLPEDFKPTNTSVPVTAERCDNCLDKEVMEAFNLMKADATSMGLGIYIASGYRSYKYQERLYNNYSAVSGVEGADTYSARAGYSEHQTGLCFDLNSVEDSFANTAEGKWINNNASNYGFIIRYPKGKEGITGYQYESWHLRYVGVDLAKKLYNDGEWHTLEEYYGISSSYQ